MTTPQTEGAKPKNEWVKFGNVKVLKFPDPDPDSEDHAADYIPSDEVYLDGNGVLESLAWAVRKNKDVLCIGDTGSGKTSAVRYLAQECNRPYRRFPCNEATDTSALVGKVQLGEAEGGGTATYFQTGIVYEAMMHGHWLLLDEFNAAHPDVRLALNPIFQVDEGRLIVPENEGEIIERHPNFRLFATGNPYHYAGVKDWNAAIMSRFDLVLWFDYLGAEEETKLLLDRVSGLQAGKAESMVQAANDVRQARKDEKITFPMSYREIHNWAVASLTFSIKRAAELTIVNKCDPEDKDEVRQLLRNRFSEWR